MSVSLRKKKISGEPLAQFIVEGVAHVREIMNILKLLQELHPCSDKHVALHGCSCRSPLGDELQHIYSTAESQEQVVSSICNLVTRRIMLGDLPGKVGFMGRLVKARHFFARTAACLRVAVTGVDLGPWVVASGGQFEHWFHLDRREETYWRCLPGGKMKFLTTTSSFPPKAKRRKRC